MPRDRIPLAKLTPPAARGVLHRARLFRRIRAAPEILWVTGPGGSGKSTLVGSYLAAEKGTALWYQVDPQDADPATFFYYLGLAAAEVCPGDHSAYPLLTPEYRDDPEAFSRRYFERLFSELPHPATVVLDEYQGLGDGCPLHRVVRAALERVPPGARVILLSREQPPPVLIRLRASGRLEVIGEQELRLTLDETLEVLRQRAGPAVTEETAAGVHRRTLGWAAGVVLTAEGLGRGDEPEGLLPLAAIFDYFAEEAFSRTGEPVRRFLLRTACLPAMTSRMAEELSGCGEGGAVLEDLAGRHFFTERHDLPEPVYRYHPLFREFLASRAEEHLPPAEWTGLRGRAARLLEAAGLAEEAAELYRQAGDDASLGRLIRASAPEWFAQGRTSSLERWLLSLSREARQADPFLLYCLGRCRLPVSPTEARDHFEEAFRTAEARGEGELAALCRAAVVDTYRYEWNDFRPLDGHINWLLGAAGPRAHFSDPAVEARVASSIAAALMIRNPGHPSLSGWLKRSVALARTVSDSGLRVQAYAFAANHLFWAGRLEEARQLMEELRTGPSGETSPLVRITFAWLAACVDIWCRIEPTSALEQVGETLEEGRRTGVRIWEPMLFALGVYGSLTAGDFAAAEGYLEQMEAALRPDRRHAYSQFHYLQCWKHYLRGNFQEAGVHGRLALRYAEETGYVFPRLLCELALARALHREGQGEQAGALLQRARLQSRQSRSLLFAYACLLLEAEMALDRGASEKALTALGRAFRLGRRRGFLSVPWWWDGEATARLCAAAIGGGVEAGYAVRLVRHHGLTPERPPLDPAHWPMAVEVRCLGGFEVRVRGAPLTFPRKTKRKPLEMLKMLVAQGGGDVPEEAVSSALWPEAEGDVAHASFATNLHRLRQMLACEQALVLREGRVRLDGRFCWVDALATDERADGALSAWQAGGSPERALELSRAVIDLYRGDFLAGEPEKWWAARFRDRLRAKVLRVAAEAGDHRQRSGEAREAAAWYERGLEIDPLAEDLYQALMRCCLDAGWPARAVLAYRRCRESLRATLELEPSEILQELYRQALSPPA